MARVLNRLRSVFGRLSAGDRLGEAFYAVWMVVVSIGLLNSGDEITRDTVMRVIFVALLVNLVWGIIDGVTVMYSRVIQRAELDRFLHELRGEPEAARNRRRALDKLNDTIPNLDANERQKIVSIVAEGEAGSDPARRRYSTRPEDRLQAMATISIDVALVLPIVAPLLLFDDIQRGVYASRLVATALFALIGWAYAKRLHRNAWLSAMMLGALGAGLFTAAYGLGW